MQQVKAQAWKPNSLDGLAENRRHVDLDVKKGDTNSGLPVTRGSRQTGSLIEVDQQVLDLMVDNYEETFPLTAS